MTRMNASPDRDLFLAAMVDDAADGQRVLWVGDAHSAGPWTVATRAERVVVLDTGDGEYPEREETDGELVVRAFSDGPPSDPYDVAVVAELSVFRSLRPALERLERLVGDGLLILATDPERGLEPEFVQDCVRDVFGAGRWFGQSGFVGDTVAELGADEVRAAAVDAGLVRGASSVGRFIAVVGGDRDRLPGYLVVQTAAGSDAVESATSSSSALRDLGTGRQDEDHDVDAPDSEDDDELEELREQLEASEEYAEEVERALAARDAALARAEDELDRLRDELTARSASPASVDDAPESDAYDDLEQRLREVGRRAAALEQEIDRRGTLVRDAVEEADRLRRKLGDGGGQSRAATGAVLPAPALTGPSLAEHARLAAELDAARFENDALRVALEGASGERAAALELVEAELMGRVRGLRARVAEVSELYDTARARLALTEADVDDARERERRLLGEIGELRERFEFELIRARSAEREPAALPDEVREHIAALTRSEAALSQRVSALSLQLAAARDLAAGAPFEGRIRALEGEVAGLRLRLDERERALADIGRVGLLAAEEAPKAAAPAVTADVVSPRDAGRGEPHPAGALAEELATRLQAANDAIDQLRTQLGLKDGLITRLQLELSDNEATTRSSEAEAHRLREESERLRGALLAASAAVDERDTLRRENESLAKNVTEPSRVQALERARDEAKAAAEAALQELLAARAETKKHAAASDASEALKAERDVLLGRVAQAIQARDEARLALRETHAILAEARLDTESPPRTPTAVGIDAPSEEEGGDDAPASTSREAEDAVQAYLERLETLESELAGQETLMRSLTAQLEERDDRIRALDRRLAGVSPEGSDAEASKRTLLELEERVARLSEELHNERTSRLGAQRRVEQLERTTEAAPDVSDMLARLKARESDLNAAEARAKSAQRDVDSLRAVLREASEGVEALLSSATASGDPATAQRLGELLTQLGRF
ncbi:MAG: hypothetical protein H6726_15530 [Sandaracinaceae bacterium]|nr:hypothetical protein [Sandaracinaceae bacterium]